MSATIVAQSNQTSRKAAPLVRLLVVLLTLFACLKVGTVLAYADSIGSITVDENVILYSTLFDLTYDLNGMGGKTVIIDMLDNWDASHGDDGFDERLYIPKNCKATFNMHGYIFNRNNVDEEDADSDEGEAVYVDAGSTLTINGASSDEEKQRAHEGVRVFYNTEQDTAWFTTTFTGGCIAGGNGDCGTGGIYLNTNKDITLNDVTIAGCKATYRVLKTAFNSGYGAGIIITQANTKLKMNRCLLTGCLAEEDGGGIYGCNVSGVSIELDGTSIYSNFANSDGGGINLDGQSVSITGKNGSRIEANKTEGYGGGVYFWNDNTTLSGSKQDENDFCIEANTAKRGGGVYVYEENNNLKNLFFSMNGATDRGGAIYVGNDYTTIENCTITGENDDHAVFVEYECDKGMHIKGSTVIKDNSYGNLTLEDDTCKIDFDRNDAMDIHIGYLELPGEADGYVITPSICLDISNQFTADDKEYEVVYSYRDKKNDDGRRLRYIKKSDESDERGHHRENPDIQTVATPDIHGYSDPLAVYAGGYTADEGGSGTTYQLRSIYAHHTSSGDKDYQTYYTDGFFFEDPVIYNNHLATASYGLATTGAYLDGYDYSYKHAAARQFMADIGCPDQMIYVNDSNMSVPGTDSIGVTIASKTLQAYDGGQLKDTDYTLVAIAVRGANYEKEWASNVTLGGGSTRDGEAQGFSEAADQAIQAIDYYINRYGLTDKIKEGKVKFWIAGFSRAGATSNLTAKRLIETYCEQTDVSVATGNQVFAYPCEPPKGGTDKAEKLADKTAYYCIHNLVNSGDLVPLVGPVEMGFKRYGVDHYLPGSRIDRMTRDEYLNRVKTVVAAAGRASSESGITQSTNYVDNHHLDTKKNMDSEETDTYRQYAARRDNMARHLATIDHTRLFTDYFYPYGTGYDWPPFWKVGDFDGAKVEDFLTNFLAFLQQEACYSRDNYAVNPPDHATHTVQEFARAFFGDPDVKDAIDKIQGCLGKMFDNYLADAFIIASVPIYHSMPSIAQEGLIDYMWSTFDDNGVFNDLTSRQKATLQAYWPTLADTALNFAEGDWDLGDYGQGDPVYPTGTQWINGSYGVARPNGAGSSQNPLPLTDNVIYALTLYNNIDMILNINHDMEVAIAWTRTYDSYYSSDTSTGQMVEPNIEYKANWVTEKSNPDNYGVEAPGAYVKNDAPGATEPYRQLKATPAGEAPQHNEVGVTQRVLLEVGQIHDSASPADVTQGDGDVFGEAIYYELYDLSSEGGLVRTELYRGGIDLPVTAGNGSFKIVAHARSLGAQSEEAIYYVTTGHKVTIDNGSGAEPVVSYYESGDYVAIAAMPAAETYFTNWTVRLLDGEGAVVADDIAQYLLGGKQANPAVRFVMPAGGDPIGDGRTYPNAYGLVIKAECRGKIDDITPSSATDKGDQALVPVASTTESPTTLADTANLTFDSTSSDPWVSPNNPYAISWTYEYKGTNTQIAGKVYPASGGDKIYGKCVYTATIVAPKDIAEDIRFASKLTASPSDELVNTYTSLTAVRDNADGNAIITIVFNETGDGDEPPQATNLLRLRGVDASNPQTTTEELGECGWVRPDTTIGVTAKSWDGHKFVRWVFGGVYGTDVTMVDGQDPTSRTIKIKISDSISTQTVDIAVYAEYEPVVTEIAAQVEAPVGGQPMQMKPTDEAGKETLKIKLKGEWYVVHPDNINPVEGFGSITWSPEPLLATDSRRANYLTAYTAGLTIVPTEKDGNSYIRVKKEGTDNYVSKSATFLYAEDLSATMNDKPAAFDEANHSLHFTFPVTTYVLLKVYPPEDVTGIPFGTAGDDLRAYLPRIKILLEGGRTMTAEAEWGDPEKAFDSLDEWSAHVWMASGRVMLPFGVENPNNVPLDVFVRLHVEAAEPVEKAVPSVDPGTYWRDQELTLSTETEGATIYWSCDPEATMILSEVPSDPHWQTYDGSMIQIRRSDAVEDEIGPDGKPTGRKLIRLRAAAFKDGMRPDGVRTYVYVFANEVKVPEGRDYEYDGMPHLGVPGGGFYTLEALSAGVTITATGDAVATEPGTYQVRAKVADGFRWEIVDPATGEVSYTTDDQVVTFTISGKHDPTKRAITYDLNGGTYGGSTDAIVEYHDEGAEIVIHAAPTRDGYTFLYWKGSEYRPGDTYKVAGDHTFVAQWEKAPNPGPEPLPQTGDDTALVHWPALALLGLSLALLGKARARR